MSKELAVVTERGAQIVIHPEFSNEQIRLLGETIAKGCDQNELSFFLNVCKLKRLDPFTGQVHVVKRWDRDLGREKMTIQVGIDGYRAIAARTGELCGNDEPIFDTEDAEHPNKATVTVYRWHKDSGQKIPYTASARYSEYVQTKKDGSPNSMWTNKPFIMLGKCAEALALRKAFPDELSGMYSDEEMGQADNEPQGTTPAQALKAPVQQPQRASAKQAAPQTAKEGDTSSSTPKTTTGSTVGGNSAATELSGVIENAKAGTNGTWWITLKTGIVMVPADKVDADMKTGYFIKLHGVKKRSDKIGDYYILSGLVELSPVTEGEANASGAEGGTPEAQSGALHPEMQEMADELFGGKKETGEAAVQGMVDSGQLKKASDLPPADKKPGTIGEKRAKRLLALCNTNKATNNGFNYDEIKRILQAMPVPAEHLKDMETGIYSQFEAWAEGKEDWRKFWEEE